MSEIVDSPRPNRQVTREAWAERLARFPDSGLTVAHFRAAEGVPVQSSPLLPTP